MKPLELPEKGTKRDGPAGIAHCEESLIALYMELTGVGENLARSVYAHLEEANSLNRGSNRA
jgi:hypothetical protein